MIVWAVGLLILAIQDIKKKTVSIQVIGALALWGVFAVVQENRLSEAVTGSLPGLALLGVSRMTKEAVGEGDAWLFCALGLYTGLVGTLEILWLSGFFAMLVGSALLLLGRDGRKTRIPMVPFVLLSYLLVQGGGFTY